MRATTDGNTVLSGGLSVFQDYVGLKLHFNDPKFIWTREKRLKLNEEQLMRRRDAFLFVKMYDQEPDREKRIQRLISGFKQDKNMWIGTVFEQEALEAHRRRMATVSALQYNFKLDIKMIVDMMEDDKIDVRKLLVSDGQSPYIIRNEYRFPRPVSDETLSLLEKAFGFCKPGSIDPLWDQRALMLSKYHHWLSIKPDVFHEQLERLVEVAPTQA